MPGQQQQAPQQDPKDNPVFQKPETFRNDIIKRMEEQLEVLNEYQAELQSKLSVAMNVPEGGTDPGDAYVTTQQL